MTAGTAATERQGYTCSLRRRPLFDATRRAITMRTALGELSYWTGCGLATIIAVAAIYRVSHASDYPVETLLLAALAGSVAWLIGRGVRFVLIAPLEEIEP
jgi:hypothetical protein